LPKTPEKLNFIKLDALNLAQTGCEKQVMEIYIADKAVLE
jgi:hypothetical protein